MFKRKLYKLFPIVLIILFGVVGVGCGSVATTHVTTDKCAHTVVVAIASAGAVEPGVMGCLDDEYQANLKAIGIVTDEDFASHQTNNIGAFGVYSCGNLIPVAEILHRKVDGDYLVASYEVTSSDPNVYALVMLEVWRSTGRVHGEAVFPGKKCEDKLNVMG